MLSFVPYLVALSRVIALFDILVPYLVVDLEHCVHDVSMRFKEVWVEQVCELDTLDKTLFDFEDLFEGVYALKVEVALLNYDFEFLAG